MAWVTAFLLVAVCVGGCSAASHLPSAGKVIRTPATAAGTAATSTPIAASTTTSPPTTTTTTTPMFTSMSSTVTAAQLGATWHTGCPVDPSQLRLLQMNYWGFDNESHVGTMVVNATVVTSVTEVFSTLYAAHFPIQEMVPESAYDGDDNTAAAADDTSGFNCRYAVAPGPPMWSIHAYGEAIDVNDLQNPYVDGAMVIPPAGASYEDRADVRPGMAVPGGTLVEAFAHVGWPWGGRWTASPDYQHFSLTGG